MELSFVIHTSGLTYMNVNHGMDLHEIANNLSNFVSNYGYD